MTFTTTVGAIAEDQKQGMTLDELATFVQNAMRQELPGTTLVHVRVNMRGGIRRVETK